MLELGKGDVCHCYAGPAHYAWIQVSSNKGINIDVQNNKQIGEA